MRPGNKFTSVWWSSKPGATQSLAGGSALVRATRLSSVPMTTRFTYTPPPPQTLHTQWYYAFQKHTSEPQIIISRETRALATITAGTATLQMCCSHDVVRKYVYNI